MISSFTVPTAKLKQLQDLVKQHDLRFVHNPTIYGENSRVTVDGDHLSQEVCNQFSADWERLTRPIVETATPVWRRVCRRIGLPV